MNNNDERELISFRKEKLAQLRNNGIAYPNDFKPTHQSNDLHNNYDHLTHDELDAINHTVSVAGRVMLRRVMGKASFVTINDGLCSIQIYAAQDILGDGNYEQFKHLDLGDIIGVCGALFKTKTNELTIKAHTCRLLAKNIQPLPEKFHGLTDQEQCYRKRYLDLIMNKSTKELFVKRSKIIASVRNTMLVHDYLEVETPMMHTIVGGANAKPFHTHHNALDMPLTLRIAPELYLKRLIVGGFKKVFEINRNFRNEGLSTRHNPEFTMIEFYQSFATYQDMMELTEEIIRIAATDVLGTTVIDYQDHTIDLTKPFARFTIIDAIMHYNSYAVSDLTSLEYLQQELQRCKIKYNQDDTLGVLQLLLFEHTTEHKLIMPTFIVDYPVDVSPLARSSDTYPELTERFELFVVGRELANGYSELNDPEEQSKRFYNQVKQKESGNDEAMHYDGDYIHALEYAMPPTGGCGIGIDRLVMLLTNQTSIKDVILFPHMRRLD